MATREASAREEIELYGSDREARNLLCVEHRKKLGKALAEAWNAGKHEMVKKTLSSALSPDMARQWKDDTAAELPAGEREEFFNFVRN